MIAALLLLGALNPWELPPPQTFADCDQRVAEHPREFEAWFCYQQISFKQPKAEWEQKTANHLIERLRKNPHDPFTELMLNLVDAVHADAAFYADAAKQLHDARSFDGEVVARTALGTFLCDEGHYPEADEQLELARTAANASGEADLVGQTLVYTANCARVRADYGRAFSLYREAYDRITSGPKTWRRAWLLGNVFDGLGQVFSKTGRHQEALEIFQAQLEQRARDPFSHACAEHRVAEEAVRLARQGGMAWEDADALIQQALADEVKFGCRIYINGGEIHTRRLYAERLGPTDEGLAQARRALEMARMEADAVRLPRPLRLLATLTIDRDAKAKAAAWALVEESIAIAKKYGLREELAESLMARAHVRAKSGDAQGSLADAQLALDELDRLREMQPDGMVRAREASEWSSAYHSVASTILEEGRPPEQAFETLERMRARSLLELLDSEALAPGSAAGARPAADLEKLRRERTRVLGQLSQVQRKLLSATLAADERELSQQQLQKLETEEEALREQIAHLGAPANLAREMHATLADVQARLGDGEAMLLFQLFDREGAESGYLPGSSWVIAVSKTQVHALKIPDAERLSGEVDLLAGLVARRDGSEVSGARVLYKQLFSEALASLGPGVTRLSIVPDGALYRLPFEALRDLDDRSLAETLEISLAPSAALWLRWRETPAEPAPIPALALGDPALAGDPSLPANSTLPQAGASLDANPIPDRKAELWTRPGPLPAARQEALAVVHELGRGSIARVGEQASEQFLKSTDLTRFGVLHIAAHSVVDEMRPERSAILLAPGSAQEDGLLQLREIGNLELRGGVVVLATCSSSAGELVQGEGAMSLARGFFQAGSRAVIGTLWPLRDDEAARFFHDFYARLGQGATVADAVATARRARIRAGAPAAAWAGLVVLGDGNSAPIAPSKLGSAVRRSAVALAVMAALLWIALRFRRARAG